jgi:hypothetical protein
MGHFERGGRHYGGTPAERALEVSMLPVVVLGAELGVDETFRRYALDVAGDPPRADAIAVRYARSGVGRRAVATLLREATVAPPGLLTTRLMNMSTRRASFVDAPLAPGDPQNALQTRYLETLQRGALVVARRGARRCLACGAYRVIGYCDSHDLEWGRAERDREAARVVLRAVAEELGLESPKAPKARREVRRR